MKIHAAVTTRDNPFTIAPVEIGEPQAGECLVELEACGICHTDLTAASGALGTPQPIVLGHEGVGHIVATGPGEHEFAVGDRVVLSFGACGQCSPCQHHTPSYCEQAALLNLAGCRADGSTALSRSGEPLAAHFFSQSSFATHAVARTTNMVKVGSDLPAELLAPLGCGVMTGMSSVMNVLAPAPGSRIAIFGCGTVGLAAVMAARLSGCGEIIAVDLNPQRTELACELGATRGVVPGRDDLAALVTELGGLHYAFDCTSHPAVIEQALGLLSQRGVLVCAGLPGTHAPLQVDPLALVFKGLTIRGTVEGDADPRQFIPRMLDWYRQGELPLEKLVSRYDFADIENAVAAMKAGDAIKPVLMMPDQN
ncbi:NAD(P)-dependent alcohol dehydrogenase [Pseudomaricurvus sp. HS19]|uniref:NAD(P)-dependent alcohol dehydrogenase n=1 Tax=Pseudomaricurvus sp. HS19 TaxID=2692626 RepID=UPI00136E9A77|nr:NAD(P)-dependent alcohol dehydrogenase [Pseudomaricurvus sp. HS19]MYM63440.1 zinc-binding dehydrogenase [Pseudomaricurvus sp. HS19]